MENGYSWVSPYREKKFLESHQKKVELLGDGLFKDNRKRVIAIMLDVQGTIDDIDDEKAKTFMNQLHRLRIKYGANQVLINLSSHMHTANGIVKYLEILHRNLKPNIILDDASYLCGTYNYETGVDEVKEFGYNLRKTEVFEKRYFAKYKILCHGIIDDSVSTDYIKKFKDSRPVFIIRASQLSESDLSRDNMMCYSTLTDGFDGVLECLNAYLTCIKDIPAYNIVEKQSEELIHLSAYEVKTMCISKNYDLIMRYVSERKLDDDDYERVARELRYILNSDTLDADELTKIRNIIGALESYLGKDNKYLLALTNKNRG